MHHDPIQLTVPLTPPQAADAVTALVRPARTPSAPAVILAHGAGTDMRHRHIQRHAADLAAAGVGVATFNFAYTEIGRRSPDPAGRLEQAWVDVVRALRGPLGDPDRLVVGGRSMGGRIASVVASSQGAALGIAGVACLAYPLHPPGRPDRLRVDHWPDLDVPILFVSGSRDAMAPIPALRDQVAAHLRPGLAAIHVVEGADHSFRVRKADGRTEDAVLDEAATAVTSWLTDRVAGGARGSDGAP